jgi:cell division protein FtsW
MEIFKPLGFDKPTAGITVALLAVGFIMVFSSSAVLAEQKYNQSLYFLIQQVIGAAAGITLIIIILSIRRPFFRDPCVIYSLLLVSLGLLAACFIMPTVARTNRWVVVANLRFQPSELAKISLVLFLAHHLDRKKDRLADWRSLILPVSIVGFFVLLILKEPDFGTAVLILAVCGLMLYLGGVRFRHLAILAGGAAVVLMVALLSASYRLERVKGFMSPEKDPLGKSFQPIQSKLAVGSGGLLGVSLGESTQKLYFLPNAHTDFIYAILVEEFGLIGTLTILTLYFLFLWRGFSVSARAPSPAAQLAGTGLTLMVGAQALLNIAIVLGLGPAKGIPLPLISFGRSSLICSLAAIGIILNISQRRGAWQKRP